MNTTTTVYEGNQPSPDCQQEPCTPAADVTACQSAPFGTFDNPCSLPAATDASQIPNVEGSSTTSSTSTSTSVPARTSTSVPASTSTTSTTVVPASPSAELPRTGGPENVLVVIAVVLIALGHRMVRWAR